MDPVPDFSRWKAASLLGHRQCYLLQCTCHCSASPIYITAGRSSVHLTFSLRYGKVPLQAAICNNAPRAMLNLLITNGARLTPSENGLAMNFAVDKTAGKGQALGASSKVLSADAIARAQATWNWVTGMLGLHFQGRQYGAYLDT